MKHIKLYEEKKEPKRWVQPYGDGTIHTSWSVDSIPHREDGPAVIITKPDGTVVSQQWWRMGERHREDGPAVIAKKGGQYWIEWYLNDKCHREDGPAIVIADEDGRIIVEEWWYEDEELKDVNSQEEFEAWKYMKSVGLI